MRSSSGFTRTTRISVSSSCTPTPAGDAAKALPRRRGPSFWTRSSSSRYSLRTCAASAWASAIDASGRSPSAHMLPRKRTLEKSQTRRAVGTHRTRHRYTRPTRRAASMERRRLRALVWATALAAAFAFRLAFGLAYDFWFEDQTQIFLIGLRHHATGAWPYFGPDVVWTRSQIPGALQGLLVGLPMDLLPVPEAPFVLLNVLSTGTLALLCAYVCRRLPSLPAW